MNNIVRNLSIIIVLALLTSCSGPGNTKSEAPEVSGTSPELYDKARDISSIAMAELMRSVKKALDKGGPVYAIEYCNLHASPLADSISKEHNCKIERVSLKYRNKNNAPQGMEEMALMNHYLEASLEKKPMMDTVVQVSGKIIYYRPIVVGMELCLNCHGKLREDISDSTLTAIYKHYPGDKAVNYSMGDFRGAWRITFDQ